MIPALLKGGVDLLSEGNNRPPRGTTGFAEAVTPSQQPAYMVEEIYNWHLGDYHARVLEMGRSTGSGSGRPGASAGRVLDIASSSLALFCLLDEK
jgi:hypothetical protein